MSHFFTVKVEAKTVPGSGIKTDITEIEVHDNSVALTFLSNLDLSSRYTTLTYNVEWSLLPLLTEIFQRELFSRRNSPTHGKLTMVLECWVTPDSNKIRCIEWESTNPGAADWVNSLLRRPVMRVNEDPKTIVNTVVSYYLNKQYWYARRYRNDDDLYLFRITGLCPDIILRNLIVGLGGSKTTLGEDLSTDKLYECFTLLNYELAEVRNQEFKVKLEDAISKVGIAVVQSTHPIVIVNIYIGAILIVATALIINLVLTLFTGMLNGVS